MIKKKYNPVCINNPTSLQHVVRLKPDQKLQLRLDDSIFPDVKLDVSTSNLLIQDFQKKAHHSIYQISGADGTAKWSDYSSVFLGDVWITSPNKSARLIVVLDTANKAKSNFFTIINPDCSDIRITPGDILEVVLFDLKFGDKDEWLWEFDPQLKCDVELIGSSCLKLDQCQKEVGAFDKDHPDSEYARYPRASVGSNLHCRQTHFWFRFNKHLVSILDQPSGLKHVGNFKFFGYINKNLLTEKPKVEYTMSVSMTLDRKYRLRALNSLLLPKHSSITPSGYVFPHGLKAPQFSYKLKNWVKGVEVSLMEEKCMEQGCEVKTALPPKEIHSNTNLTSFGNFRGGYDSNRYYSWDSEVSSYWE